MTGAEMVGAPPPTAIRVVALIGPVGARVWRRYLVGGAFASAEGRMGVDQILALRPIAGGSSGMPPSRKAFLT